MLALPPAAPPPPQRQLLFGTALSGAAGATLFGGMLALWLRFRDAALAQENGTWLPRKIHIPEVASNIMLLTFVGLCVFAQWAIYSARRDDKSHTALALFLTGLMGLAIINAQVVVWIQMKLPINDGTGSAYGVMFYSITGAFLVVMIIGMVFTFITAFRYLGGRVNEREIVTAHAIYWYFAAAAFAALWYVVYVTK
jgi:cytochrome c oxidase subunit 3